MTILVVQSTAGTSQLNGSAPDPTNVPGNNWYSDLPSGFVRKSGGGVLIPNSANLGILSYNVATARQKITFANVVLNSTYIRFQINGSTQSAAVFNSGDGYYLFVQPGAGVYVAKFVAGANSSFGSTSASLPSAPITITSVYLEHLVSGTINARVVVGGTNYDSTLTDASPLTGTYAGLFASNTFATGIPADSITIEDNVSITYTYARPTSDITTQWSPSTGTDHYALIDEVTASDADYIFATAAGQTDEVKLAAMTAPKAGTSVDVQYRVQGVAGGGKVTLSLVCGTTVIATDAIRSADGDYVLTVAPGTWAAVTDWSNMRLRFVSSI